MLPAPISSPSYSSYGRPRKTSYASNSRSSLHRIGGSARDVWARRLQHLFVRSRVTNLAVLLLALVLAASLLLNIRYWLSECSGGLRVYSNAGVAPAVAAARFESLEDTISRQPRGITELDHLIVVPGHGIWVGDDAGEAYDENKWLLAGYQVGNRDGGEGARKRIEAFVEHIRRGVELADSDPGSLLVFSGGSTRPGTAISESASYFSLALALSFINPTSASTPAPTSAPTSALSTYQRTTTEDYALDSFQNLLFSIARFRTVTGHYPERITVVGYAMKAARFTELHRAALRWPQTPSRWEYVGIDIEDAALREEAEKGEHTNGYVPYSHDLYGCHDLLLTKRRGRNVHRKTHPYHASAPELASLFEWCPNTTPSRVRWKFSPDGDSWSRQQHDDQAERRLGGLFQGPLPWDGL